MKNYVKNLGGLVNKDLSFSKVDENTLYDSVNFRVTANDDGTFAARTNIKGNSFVVEIPNAPARFSIKSINPSALVNGYTYTLVLNVSNLDNSVSSTFSWTFQHTNIEGFYINLAQEINNLTLNATSVFYNASAVLNPDFSGIQVQGPFSLGGFSINSFQQVFPTPAVDVSGSLLIQVISQTITGLKIIGWVSMRDDLILITTNGTFDPDVPSSGPFVSYGQLWKLSYDKGLDPALPSTYSITLLYNDLLNLTIHRPIANPGMIEARYESAEIMPIYWTDNYNPPRKANVADPNLYSITPNGLNLLPSLSMDPPVLKYMESNGNLPMGVYQVTYRLKNANGSESRFSRPSKLIPVIDQPEPSGVNGFIEYFPQAVYDPVTGITTQQDVPLSSTNVGTGGNTGKAIKIGISNLDTSYTTIEVVSIYYDGINPLPQAYIVKIDAIPVTGYYEAIINKSSNDIPITLDELTAFNASIVRCKTLATKSQTLFLGNIKTTGQDFNFDSRTYRFPLNATTTTIKSSSGTVYTINNSYQIIAINGNPVLPYDIPDDYDCIQDYDMQAPTSYNNCLYLPGTPTLGGEGPNLKYVFVTEDMVLDEGKMWFDQGLNYRYVSPSTKIFPNMNGATVEHITGFADNKSPYIYDAVVGYRRDEMERFGIVFFDEYDNPTYVQWIADIRFPHQFMPDPNASTRTLLTTNLSESTPTTNYIGSTPEGVFTFKSPIVTIEPQTPETDRKLIGNILGLRITIKNFTGIPTTYKKCGIVRVPKQDNDRHILGQGMVRPTFKHQGSGPGDPIWAFTMSNGWYHIAQTPGNTMVADGLLIPDIVTFTSPEFMFSALNGFNFVDTDTLEITGLARKTKMGATPLLTGGWNEYYSWIRPRDGVIWKNDKRGDDDESYFHGIITKQYYLEGINGVGPMNGYTPRSIKNPNTNNPYKLLGAHYCQNKFLSNGGYNSTNFDQAYDTGIRLLGGGGNTRIVYNCSVKRPDKQGPSYTWTADNSAVGCPSYGSVRHKDMHSHGNATWILHLDPVECQDFNIFGFGGQDHWGEDRMQSDRWSSSYNHPAWAATGMNIYLANYRRVVTDQYGGNSYSDRTFSKYVSTNCYIDISAQTPVTTKVFGGDTAVNVMDYVVLHLDQSMDKHIRDEIRESDEDAINHIVWHTSFPCETHVALDYRRSYQNYKSDVNRNVGNDTRSCCVPNRGNLLGAFNYNSGKWNNRPYNLEFSEYFHVDKVYNYNYDKYYMYYYPKPYFEIEQTEFDFRVIRSEKKLDLATPDTWTIFKPDAFIDVESKYGPINNLIVFKDKLLYFQDRAFGQLQVAEQKLIGDAAGTADLVLGSSGILERYDYISRQTGTKHQFSMSVSDYSLIWFDTLARKIYKLGEGLDPLTDLKGYHSLTYNLAESDLQNNDNPYMFNGIHSTYDYRFNEFYMTFLQPEKPAVTLVYNDMYKGFIGEYTHYPVVYINDKSNIFSVPYTSPSTNDTLYVHNYGDYCRFYGSMSPEPSKISYLMNTEPTVEKVFTNMEVSAEAFKTVFGYDQPDFNDFFDTMRVYDNYQNTNFFSLANFATKHKTIWDIKIPSDRVLDVTLSIFNPANLSPLRPPLTRRLKDKWFIVDLIYNNTDNNKFVVNYATNIYMPNSR